ncbi:MAG TPA: CopD family protein [Gemmatimonadaceae bacterium]|nr:CopD family protein [Gemmatimonadaceae bacterium]
MRSLALFVTAMLVAVPQNAFAHGLLRSSTPSANSVLVEPPPEIRLTFTEAPERAFTRIRLIGPAGEIPLEPMQLLVGNVAHARISGRLAPAMYRVEWQTAGADGHPVSGQFSFTVGSGTAAGSSVPDTAPSGAAPMHDPMGPVPGMAASGETDPFSSLGAILRWLTLMGTIAAIGTVAFRYTVLARVSLEVDREITTDYLPAAARGAAVVGAIAALLLLLTGFARLAVQSLAMHGADSALDWSMLSPMISHTNWGLAWVTQLLGAAAAGVSFLLIRRGREWPWLLAVGGGVTIAAGLALASHAAVVPRMSAASTIANGVHTIAAAGWLGNLLLVFAVGLPLAWRLDRDDRWTVVRDIINAFSPAALAFGALAGVTGVFMAWTHVGSISALTNTDYGNVLLIKIGLISLTAVTGAYNWLRVRPSLGDHTGARRLRRSAGAELAIAVLVLAVTAVLVALPLPTTR